MSEQSPVPLDQADRRVRRRPTRFQLDRNTGDESFETIGSTTSTRTTLIGHHQMTNMTGVTVVAVDESSVDHQSRPHARSHHDGEKITMFPSGTQPTLRQREGFGVVVDMSCQTGEFRNLLAKGEVAPTGNMQR